MPRGVTVTRAPLERLFMVRIHAGAFRKVEDEGVVTDVEGFLNQLLDGDNLFGAEGIADFYDVVGALFDALESHGYLTGVRPLYRRFSGPCPTPSGSGGA